MQVDAGMVVHSLDRFAKLLRIYHCLLPSYFSFEHTSRCTIDEHNQHLYHLYMNNPGQAITPYHRARHIDKSNMRVNRLLILLSSLVCLVVIISLAAYVFVCSIICMYVCILQYDINTVGVYRDALCC